MVRHPGRSVRRQTDRGDVSVTQTITRRMLLGSAHGDERWHGRLRRSRHRPVRGRRHVDRGRARRRTGGFLGGVAGAELGQGAATGHAASQGPGGRHRRRHRGEPVRGPHGARWRHRIVAAGQRCHGLAGRRPPRPLRRRALGPGTGRDHAWPGGQPAVVGAGDGGRLGPHRRIWPVRAGTTGAVGVGSVGREMDAGLWPDGRRSLRCARGWRGRCSVPAWPPGGRDGAAPRLHRRAAALLLRQRRRHRAPGCATRPSPTPRRSAS